MGTQSDSDRWARQGAFGAQSGRRTSLYSSVPGASARPAAKVVANLPALDTIDAPEWGDPDWRAASLARQAAIREAEVRDASARASLPPDVSAGRSPRGYPYEYPPDTSLPGWSAALQRPPRPQAPPPHAAPYQPYPHRSSPQAPGRSDSSWRGLPSGYVPLGRQGGRREPEPWSPRVWDAWESHSPVYVADPPRAPMADAPALGERSRGSAYPGVAGHPGWRPGGNVGHDAARHGTFDDVADFDDLDLFDAEYDDRDFEDNPDFAGDDHFPWAEARGGRSRSVWIDSRRPSHGPAWQGALGAARNLYARDSSRVQRMVTLGGAAGRWLLRAGSHRPEVWFPELLVGSLVVEERRFRLPPVWLLVNISVLLLIVLGLVPSLNSPARAEGCGWYTVQSGDTIDAISSYYHVPMGNIIKRNSLMMPPDLLVGEQLCIPTGSLHDTALTAIPHPAAPPVQAANAPSASSASSAPKSVSGEAAFVAYVLPYAQRAHADTGWPTSVILAQWGLEHGWKLPGFTGYNFGNVAALPGEQTTPGTQVWGSPAAFSYAATPEDGLRQYLHVAHLGYYSGVGAAAANGADAAAVALGSSPWDAGHYTSDGNPGDSLLNIMHSYNLYQYDQ